MKQRPVQSLTAMVTSNGHMYVQTPKAAKAALAKAAVGATTDPSFPGGHSPTSPGHGNTTSPASRKLLIYGADGRIEAPDSHWQTSDAVGSLAFATFPYPFRAVGRLTMSGGSCSGALIGPSSVLTLHTGMSYCLHVCSQRDQPLHRQHCQGPPAALRSAAAPHPFVFAVRLSASTIHTQTSGTAILNSTRHAMGELVLGWT